MAEEYSVNNVTVRKLAKVISGVWQKTISAVSAEDAKKPNRADPYTAGHIVVFDGNGNLQDSNYFPSAFANESANSAVQSVKIGSTTGDELNKNTTVVLPFAASDTNGIMPATAMAKLDSISSGAQPNQNAFSTINFDKNTISAGSPADFINIGVGNYTSAAISTNNTFTIGSTLSSKSAAKDNTDVSLVTRGEKYIWGSKQDALEFEGEYNSATNKVATMSAVNSSIGNLNYTATGLGTAKTITAVTETDGVIAVTAADIKIAETQVTDLTAHLGEKANLVSPHFSGIPTAPTPALATSSEQIATTEYVIDKINEKIGELGDAMVYEGMLSGGTSGNYGAFTPSANKGWTYKISAAGKIDGITVEIGDMLICNTDTVSADISNYNDIKNNWDFIQANIDGAVIGPAEATVKAVAGFADNTGKILTVLSPAEIRSAAELTNVANTKITVDPINGVTDVTNSTTYKYTHPTSTSAAVAAVKVGRDNLGHVELGGNLTKGDVGLDNVDNTSDKNKPISDATQAALNEKVNTEEGKGLSTNDFTNEYKTKLDDIASGAEVNQSAFSVVKVGTTNISANGKTDTLTLSAGNNIKLTPNASTRTVTISATDTTYEFDGTYNASTNKAATVSTVTSALAGVSAAEAGGAGKYISKIKQENGKIVATTTSFDSTLNGTSTNAPQTSTVYNSLSGKEDKSNKVTTWSTTVSDTNYPSEKLVKASLDGKADSNHVHGNITSGGFISTNGVTIGTGDRIVITDSSNKVTRTSITFATSGTNRVLTEAGTWADEMTDTEVSDILAALT